MGNENITTQFCRKCGARIPGDSVYCLKCGEKVVNIPEEEINCPVSPEEESLCSDSPVAETQHSVSPYTTSLTEEDLESYATEKGITTDSAFQVINQKREEAGLPPLKDPRKNGPLPQVSTPNPKTASPVLVNEKPKTGKEKKICKSTIIPFVLIAAVIMLQVFLVHPGIAMNNVYAMGVPLSLIPLLTPTTNPITGVYRPTNYYGDLFTSQFLERVTRSALTGEPFSDDFNIYGHEALQNECFAFMFIWVFLVIEIILFCKCCNRSVQGKYLAYLVIPAISVNIWSELLYVFLGQVNAVVSFGFAFGLYLVVYYIVKSAGRKEKEVSSLEMDPNKQ